MAMYAGCGTDDIADIRSAAGIIGKMMSEAVPLRSPSR
jgi:hypothetical protein